MGRAKLARLFHTLKYLKFKQLYYRGYYMVRNKLVGKKKQIASIPVIHKLRWESNEVGKNSYLQNSTFVFLNIEHNFGDKIDWNHADFGKLWTYNLNYFDFLNQTIITKEQGIELIYDYISNDANLKDGLEPYPISLRGINWIKFISKYGIENTSIDKTLFEHYQLLRSNIEYHLLGNHLLENGFSLLFGAYYFRNEMFYERASKIVKAELNEQILDDGGHFELSPMYHQIILLRVLDCINLINSNHWKNDDLLDVLIIKSKKMLGWLDTITFGKGTIPMLNDSTFNIAPTSKELFNYASSIKLTWSRTKLGSSGYRKYANDQYECIMDVGNIGPDYIPGHAHSDTFNFEMYVKGEPFIVDTGITTYEKNSKRQKERSTKAHNTVVINNEDQSEVWGGFRVGRRAKIVLLEESNLTIRARHNGYKHLGIIHERSFVSRDRELQIVDKLIGNSSKYLKVAHIHFHPSVKLDVIDNEVITSLGTISFSKEAYVEIQDYHYSNGFNKSVDSKKVVINFKGQQLTSLIRLAS